MVTTSNDIANEAIQLMGGNQPFVTGLAPNFDSSVTGKALQKLYAPTVATVARQHEWDFARQTVALALSGNVAPFPWAYEYVYPANCVQLWQLAPAALTDANNTLPINSAVGNAIVGAAQAKVIWSNLQNANAVINSNPLEATWDALFREAVVRLLASALAMAIGGKPDVAQSMLESGGAFETLAEGRES